MDEAATQQAIPEAERPPVAEELLKVYLGERSGARVLAGRTKRGDGEKIHAVIWLCDLRHSTRMSETMPVEDFFRTLSDFFDCTADAVLAHGGEILSFPGDAVLAIFAIGGSERPLEEACYPKEGPCLPGCRLGRSPGGKGPCRRPQPEARGAGRGAARVRPRPPRW